MSKITNAMRGLDDLLFENKNKNYGAYSIRRHYNERLAAGITATAGLLLSMWLFILLSHHKVTPYIIPYEKPLTFTEIEFPPKVETKAGGGETQGKIEPKLGKKDMNLDTSKHDEGDGNDKIAGLPGGFGKGIFKPGPIGNLTVKEKTIITSYKKPHQKFVDVADFDAEFPGGDAGLEKFVQNNFNYPNFAIENGLGGTLVLELYIDENGKVMGHKILMGLRGGFNEEAAKLVKKMPDWKPARIGKEPIAAKRIINLKLNPGGQ